MTAPMVVKAIHQAGGIAILAHPARYRISFTELIKEASLIGFDGAEAWYDYEYRNIWTPTEFVCSSVDKLLKKHNLLSSCGTDTHGGNILTR